MRQASEFRVIRAERRLAKQRSGLERRAEARREGSERRVGERRNAYRSPIVLDEANTDSETEG